MRQDRHGVAALFDALIFLAVAALVSVALLEAFAHIPDPRVDGAQKKVEAAHTVLLRSTLKIGNGNNCTVLEAAAVELRSSTSNLTGGIALKVLTDLLPGMELKWTVKWNDHVLFCSTSDVPDCVSIYSSIAKMDFPWGRVDYQLMAWQT